MENSENFEKVLKKELGTLEKHLVDFQENMSNQLSEFKSEMKNEMTDFKSEMRNGMSDFKSEIKNEMSNFKSEIKDEMNNLKTEVTDEIRERFFCFEQDYGTEIDAIYDKVILDKQVTDEVLHNIQDDIDKKEMRILDNSVKIDLIQKNINSTNN